MRQLRLNGLRGHCLRNRKPRPTWIPGAFFPDCADRWAGIFLLEGEKTVHFAGAQVTIQPHEFVLLADRGADYHAILLLFDPQLLTDFFSRHAAWLDPPARPTVPQPFLRFEQDAFLTSFVRSLDSLLGSGSLAVPRPLQAVKLEELLGYLALHYPGLLGQFRSLGSEASNELLIRQAVTSHIGHLFESQTTL